jgi:hypothetical protein
MSERFNFYTQCQAPNSISNCQFVVPSKRFRYDAVLKRKVVVLAAERGDGTAGRESADEENVLRRRNGHVSIFSCKATTIIFVGP